MPPLATPSVWLPTALPLPLPNSQPSLPPPAASAPAKSPSWAKTPMAMVGMATQSISTKAAPWSEHSLSPAVPASRQPTRSAAACHSPSVGLLVATLTKHRSPSSMAVVLQSIPAAMVLYSLPNRCSSPSTPPAPPALSPLSLSTTSTTAVPPLAGPVPTPVPPTPSTETPLS